MLISMPSTLSPPLFDALPPETKVWITDADARLSAMPAEPVGMWAYFSSTFEHGLPSELEHLVRRCLSDPLQGVFNEYHGLEAEALFGDPLLRTEAEKSYVPSLARDLSAAYLLNSFEQFIGCIEAASSHFLQTRSEIRAKPVYIAPDANGHFVEYMDQAAVRPTLLRAFQTLLDEQAPLIYRAAVVYILVAAAHPFRDGNGRLARALFNAILIHGGMDANAYIPLKRISRLSRGGMALHMRRAQLKNDWLPMLAGLSGAVILTAQMRHLFLERFAKDELIECGT